VARFHGRDPDRVCRRRTVPPSVELEDPMITAPIRSLLAVLAVVVTGLVLAACGSDNATGPTPAQIKDAAGQATQSLSTTSTATTTAPATTTAATTTQQAAADGKAVFTANCASCHTLSVAGASGQVGPNLDTLKPSESAVSSQVEKGGGAMPAFAGQLSDAEIKAVAAYVASNAGA
jgi:mono/diheme cytochrome c family protein